MDFRVLMVLFLPLHSSEPDEFRLVGGTSRCEGRLEVKRQGLDWSPVAAADSNLNLANRLCTELHCGSALSIRETQGSKKQTWFISHECEKPSLGDCFNTLPFHHTYSQELNCSDSVRLLHGPRRCSGSLELYWERSWTSVCEEDFDLLDAEVVCRELCCGAPSLHQGALSGEGQTFHCEGHESALMDCPRTSSARICTSGKAVNLTCSDPGDARLVGQPSRCAGTLEVKLQGQWRRMYYDAWEKTSPDVVCRELNCGPGVSGEKREDFPELPVWEVSHQCVMKTAALGECVFQSDFDSPGGTDVVCSDLLTHSNISLTGVSEALTHELYADGVSEAQLQGFRVLLGSHFWVTCSIDPQYPGGSFQLLSPISQNHTFPAVNHSAQFLFSDAGPAHKGNYSCVYHLHVFNHTFSSQSHPLYLTLGASDSDLIIRVLVIFLLKIIYTAALVYFYCKNTRRQRSTQQ